MPKFRRPLNASQEQVLLSLYKFRFGTVELLAKYQDLKSPIYMYTRLRNMIEQKYIGRRYSGLDSINRKPAAYHLMSEGLSVLKTMPGLNPTVLHAIRNDKRAGPVFIEESLLLLRLYVNLVRVFGDTLSFYTKSELAQYDFFPERLPDAHLTFKGEPSNSKSYMLEFIKAATPFFVVKLRISQYIEHYESGDWDETGTDYPAILLVCETPALERRLQKHAEYALDQSDAEELEVYTTTTKALKDISGKDDAILSDVYEPESLKPLIR